MWERFKFWMMGYKDCAGCCLGCSFFEECKADVFSEMNEQEAYERDVCIDAIIKERMPDRYNKTAQSFWWIILLEFVIIKLCVKRDLHGLLKEFLQELKKLRRVNG